MSTYSTIEHPLPPCAAESATKVANLLRFAKPFFRSGCRVDAGDDRLALFGPEPLHLRIAAKPCQLPFGVAARVAFDLLDRLVAGDPSVEEVEEFVVARPERIEVAVGEHGPRFGFEPFGEHGLDAEVDPCVEAPRAGGRRRSSRSRKGVRDAGPSAVRSGTSGLQTDLQRPHDAGRIPPVDLLV